MNRECPRCHVVFWKDPGETLGAMYLDFAVAAASFLVCWAILALATHLSDAVEILILCAVACGSVLLCYPLTRSGWTVLLESECFAPGGKYMKSCLRNGCA